MLSGNGEDDTLKQVLTIANHRSFARCIYAFTDVPDSDTAVITTSDKNFTVMEGSDSGSEDEMIMRLPSTNTSIPWIHDLSDVSDRILFE